MKLAKSAPALINPEMLKWAREERGFDVETVAKRFKMSPKDLTAFENGTKLLTFAKFREIASYYKRATAVFFLDQIPPPMKMPGFRRLPDHLDEPISPELKLEIRRFHQKREDVIDLLDYAPTFDWAYLDTADLTENPEKVGLRLRELLRIPDDFPAKLNNYQTFNSWRERIESLGTFVFLARNVGLTEMRGLSIVEKPFPFIAVNRKDSPRPRCFTLLHEFCHLLLKDSSICEIKHEHDYHIDKHEVFCNHVAGAALVPKHLLLETPAVRSHGRLEDWSNSELSILAGRFRVSREVILRRLLILGKTSVGFYRTSRQNLGYPPLKTGGGGGGETTPQRVLYTDGVMFTSIVLEALNRNAISYADASDMLGMKVEHIGTLESLVDDKRR